MSGWPSREHPNELLLDKTMCIFAVDTAPLVLPSINRMITPEVENDAGDAPKKDNMSAGKEDAMDLEKRSCMKML